MCVSKELIELLYYCGIVRASLLWFCMSVKDEENNGYVARDQLLYEL